MVGFSPPSDAIAEFKVQTNAFDAQTGHTAGAVVNLAVKSGTNALHGHAGYFNRGRQPLGDAAADQRADGEKPTRDYNRYTGTLPAARSCATGRSSWVVRAPARRAAGAGDLHRADARMRRATSASSATRSSTRRPRPAPTTAHRRSRATRFLGPHRSGGRRLCRPLPASPTGRALEDNYFTNQLRPYDYNAGMGRVDHNFNASNRLFVTGYWNKRQEDRYNWAQGAANATDGGVINGFEVTKGSTTGPTPASPAATRRRCGRTCCSTCAGAGRSSASIAIPAQEFDPAVAGLLGAARAMGDYNYLPLITFGGVQHDQRELDDRVARLAALRLGRRVRPAAHNISFAPTVTRCVGRSHASRRLRPPDPALGDHQRRIRRWPLSVQRRLHAREQHGGAERSRAVMGAVPPRAADHRRPTRWRRRPRTSSQFEIASPGSFTQVYHHFFVQDDWRVSPKLTANLGAAPRDQLGA